MIDFKKTRLAAMLIAAGFAGQVAAHMYTNFPTYDRGGLYEKSKAKEFPYYKDGAFGPIRFNVQHACDPEPYFDFSNVTTKQVAIVIPTGKDVQLVDTVLKAAWEFPPFDPAYKELGPASPDADGNDWGIQFLKPQPNPALPKAYAILGETSKGETIPRAVVWVGDHPDTNDTDLVATIYFPEIPEKSCVQEVQYFFPSAQFCGNFTPVNAKPMEGWLLGTTAKWSKSMLGETEVQWAPIALVNRDLKAKPLPASCNGKGKKIGVYPSKADIDKYLRPVSVDKKGVATQQPPNWWINHIH